MTGVFMLVFVVLTFFVAPYVDERRQRAERERRELERCGGRVPLPRTCAPRCPRSTDPSPRPLRKEPVRWARH